jgi:hypothetical protein
VSARLMGSAHDVLPNPSSSASLRQSRGSTRVYVHESLRHLVAIAPFLRALRKRSTLQKARTAAHQCGGTHTLPSSDRNIAILHI